MQRMLVVSSTDRFGDYCEMEKGVGDDFIRFFMPSLRPYMREPEGFTLS
jgi:hypothetical protein